MATTSRDLAQFLLEEHGQMDTWKLQKLVCTIQAFHLAEHERPAFDDEIQAWVDGPVAPRLFSAHQNQRYVTHIYRGRSDHVPAPVRKTAAQVWEMLGAETGRTLREMSHADPAWLEARALAGVKPDEPCDEPLSLETMGTAVRQYLDAAAKIPKPTTEQLDGGTPGLRSYLEDALRAAG